MSPLIKLALANSIVCAEQHHRGTQHKAPIKPASDLELHRRHAGLHRAAGGGTPAAVESSGVKRTKKRCSAELVRRAQTKKH